MNSSMRKNYRSRILVAALLLYGLAALGGCSTSSEVRDGAKLMSVYTAGVQQQLEVFSDAQLQIDRARLRNMDRLEESAIDTLQRNQAEVAAWQLTTLTEAQNKNVDLRARLFELIQAGTEKAATDYWAFQAQRAEREKVRREMKAAVEFDKEKLAKAAKTLADLAEERDFEAQASFLIGFAAQVRSSIEELEKASQAEAEAAEKTQKEQEAKAKKDDAN